ncbi:MAG: hypothetical protein JKY67_04450 [Pseudomonadales bacterium]|nr:hypothetical protein [Pseudomonadales bacterium]
MLDSALRYGVIIPDLHTGQIIRQMNSFRASCWQKKAIVALMLLGLLLQVQTVFACQMMEHSGPIKHCCCGDMAVQKQADDGQSEHLSCCDISTELTLKASDLESNDPVALQSGPAFELPQTTLVFLLVSLWPEVANPPLLPEIWDLDADPGSPGTNIYLSTLRLRI